MFPFGRIPFNFPFLKKDGSISTIGDEISSGGGGGYTLPTASATKKGGVKIGAGLTMTDEVLSNDNPTPYTLPTASAETKGGVKIGSGLSMDGETLNNSNPTPYTLPTASDSVLGGVKVGSGLTITDGVLSNDNPTPYSLPTASNSVKGGVMVGNTLTISSDVLDVRQQNPTFTIDTTNVTTTTEKTFAKTGKVVVFQLILELTSAINLASGEIHIGTFSQLNSAFAPTNTIVLSCIGLNSDNSIDYPCAIIFHTDRKVGVRLLGGLDNSVSVKYIYASGSYISSN